MVSLTRREMLASSIISPSLIASGSASATSSAANNRLLVIFLRGAYDAINVVIPTYSELYHASRPTIGLGMPNSNDPKAPLPLDEDWSLHPALKESILPFWKSRQIAFVPFVGSEDMSRSHFETQDTIEMGQALAKHRNYQSGFMGRLSSVLSASKPISFTSQVPLCFRGGPVIPNMNLGGAASNLRIDASRRSLIEEMYKDQVASGIDLYSIVQQGFNSRDEVFNSLKLETDHAARQAVTAKGFEVTARNMAWLMRDHFNLGFIDVGGWDTHVNQGGSEGNLATRISELGRGLSVFASEIGPEAWTATTVFVISEFGRTFSENGNKGTDHGHGSIYWVLGGGIKGGKISGEQVHITPETLNQGRDLPVLTDYRALFSGVLGRQFNLSTRQLNLIFPGTTPIDLGLI